MQPTKYPLQASPMLSSAAFSLADGLLLPEGGEAHRIGLVVGSEADHAGPCLGGEAPLDLIEEHLTFDTLPGQYRQVTQGGRLFKNWLVPHGWAVPPSGERSYVMKVQPFEHGGFEVVCRKLDLEKIASAMDGASRRTGKRDAPAEIDPQHVAIASSRAKRRVRYLVKNMMATHLVTLTKRETLEGGFWNPDDWAKAWDRFRRLLAKVIGDFPYVAILEKHQKGNYHLHVAWCGRVNVQLVRKIWLAVIGGGKGCGNIDARLIKVKSGGDRASRISRYISKYVSKHFEEDSRFNKKRYWASRQTLPECRRYVLTQVDSDDVLSEVSRVLGLDWSKFLTFENGKFRRDNFYIFPDEFGIWVNYIPELHDPGPPF